MRTDDQLQQDVQDELKWDPSIEPSAIGVVVKEGIVTLTGHVESFVQKWAAERATERVKGVRGVVMEIDVSLPGSSRRKDADLAQAAMHALDWNSSVPHDSVRIIVNDGWVTLSGEVDWAYQRAAAVGAIRNLIGVAGIYNEISLCHRPIDAHDVKKRMLAALHRQAQLDANAISIAIDGSTVTLGGVVDSWSERVAARNAAWSAQGVQRVIDNLSVPDELTHV